MRKPTLALGALAALVFIPLPALAGETPWQTVAPGARMRIVHDDQRSGGKTRIAVEMDMDKGLHTYWKVPGETGIPAQFSLWGSSGPISREVFWPLPERLMTAGYLDNVYTGHLLLPMQIALPAGQNKANVDVTMGVCSNICIPVKATFAVDFDFAKPDLPQSLAIAQAITLAPQPYPDGDGPAPVGAVHYDAAKKGVALTYEPARVDPARLFVTIGDTGLVFGTPETDPDMPGHLFVPLLNNRVPENISSLPVTLTFATDKGVFALAARAANG